MRKSVEILLVWSILTAGFYSLTSLEAGAKNTTPSPVTKPSGTTALLILGTDQRQKEKNYRTDVNMVLILRPSVKKAIIASFPRDLNYGGRKLNSIYPLKGSVYAKEVFSSMTGIKIDNYTAVSGFNSFVWAIEQMNGLDVNVEMDFIDKQYPGDRENWGPISLEFKKGQQHMDGERALKYARSRKGNNGEGSDFSRMRRQQNLLLAMPEAFLKNRKSLIEFSAKGLLDLITGKIKTDLGVNDVANLYGFLNDYKSWNIEKLVIDTTNYATTANSKYYGRAYTLLPKGGNYKTLQKHIYQKLQ